MSVEVINGFSSTQRVRVVYHDWRATETTGGEVAQNEQGTRAIPWGMRSAGAAGPIVLAGVIGGAAAFDATQTVLTATLAGMALLAMKETWVVLAGTFAGRRRIGRHRATTESRRVVVAGTWWTNADQP